MLPLKLLWAMTFDRRRGRCCCYWRQSQWTDTRANILRIARGSCCADNNLIYYAADDDDDYAVSAADAAAAVSSSSSVADAFSCFLVVVADLSFAFEFDVCQRRAF